eukprot:TRINITY_DN8447_c3_g1_i1.p1 TRINITY_DN8447_c3_g1~~TRINITY_DN8447_c3_g1_i1.p1  ORF type:complete len:370 (+),score=157.49 TRINITY_DN8447_c3_g1_i1:163-1110(+)
MAEDEQATADALLELPHFAAVEDAAKAAHQADDLEERARRVHGGLNEFLQRCALAAEEEGQSGGAAALAAALAGRFRERRPAAQRRARTGAGRPGSPGGRIGELESELAGFSTRRRGQSPVPGRSPRESSGSRRPPAAETPPLVQLQPLQQLVQLGEAEEDSRRAAAERERDDAVRELAQLRQRHEQDLRRVRDEVRKAERAKIQQAALTLRDELNAAAAKKQAAAVARLQQEFDEERKALKAQAAAGSDASQVRQLESQLLALKEHQLEREHVLRDVLLQREKKEQEAAELRRKLEMVELERAELAAELQTRPK